MFILCFSTHRSIVGKMENRKFLSNSEGCKKITKVAHPTRRGFFSVFFFFLKFILKSSKTLKQILNLIHISVYCVSLEINPNSNLDLLVPYDILHVKIVLLICQKMKGPNLFKNVPRI